MNTKGLALLFRCMRYAVDNLHGPGWFTQMNTLVNQTFLFVRYVFLYLMYICIVVPNLKPWCVYVVFLFFFFFADDLFYCILVFRLFLFKCRQKKIH